MLLCQLWSRPFHSRHAHRRTEGRPGSTTPENGAIDINNVYATRPEVRSLELATQIYKQKVNVTRSEYLPSIALMGSLYGNQPFRLNSFEKSSGDVECGCGVGTHLALGRRHL